MTGTPPLSRFLALSVPRRIFGGFAVVLLLLVALAAVALRGIELASDGAATVSRNSVQAMASTEIGLLVGDARARVERYALTATMDDQKAAQSSLADLGRTIERDGSETTGVDLRQLVSRYRAAVDASIAAVEARRSSVDQMLAAATELRTIVSATTDALGREPDPGLSGLAARLAASFGETDGSTARFVASRIPADANVAADSFPMLRQAIDALRAATEGNRRIQRFVKGMDDPFGRFEQALRQVAAADQQLHVSTDAREAAAAVVLHETADRQARAALAQSDAIGAMQSGTRSARDLSLLTAASAIVVGLVLAVLIGRGISRPLVSLTGAMRQLADGNLALTVPNAARRDELGEMARAVEVFKDNAIAMRTLQAEQASDRKRAEQEKQAALRTMAETIETRTGIALENIRQRTTAMLATADEMGASANRTGGAAETAAGAAAQALANAQTVASAAEQLAASIHEIGGQVTQSAEASGRAVTASAETRATIETLNQEVTQIGSVADMIGEIAARTNLLALNATIEAARAGDAGKGFAVVAVEVKQLAAQTAHSTSEIARHINQVRTATGASVEAVRRIEQTITELNAIASAIAAAVEQQGAATAEIARNVSETARAANEMTARTTEVSTEAADTGRRATDVRDNVTGMSAAVEDLRHSVIEAVRTSTVEVDRRATPRHIVDLPCRLTAGGQVHDARVVDLSEAGARVRGGPALLPDLGGVLEIDGMAMRLPFIVKAGDDDSLHMAFMLDAAAAAEFRAMTTRLAPRLAA